MRVIAGSAGGIPLASPKTDLRPTMEKVKAAIFSSLGDRVPGSRVADLFAGTGALGIEALSRGAASAIFVESNAQAATTLEANLTKTRLAGAVLRLDVFRFLARPGSHGPFDLVFADPPYARYDSTTEGQTQAAAWRLLEDPHLPDLLDPEGLLVLEHPPRAALPESPRWVALRTRAYGKTSVSYFAPAGR